MSKNFNQERLLQVLVAPQISEKATMLADKNEQVQIANLKGKSKRFGRFMGRRNDVRKAFVCLKPGQEINFVEGGAA